MPYGTVKENKMILYHYTTKEGYDQIKRTKQFILSDKNTTMDAASGDGLYFTKIDPEKCESYLTFACWGIPVFDRTRYYFKCSIVDTIVKECRPNVYLVKSWEIGQLHIIEDGATRYCPTFSKNGTHTICEKYKKYF